MYRQEVYQDGSKLLHMTWASSCIYVYLHGFVSTRQRLQTANINCQSSNSITLSPKQPDLMASALVHIMRVAS